MSLQSTLRGSVLVLSGLGLFGPLVACGDDTTTGGNGGASGGNGGNGGGDGASGPVGGDSAAGGSGGEGGGKTADCQAIETAYREAVAKAKSCDPAIDIPQCTELVPSELSCPCDTSINPANAEAVAEMDMHSAQWDAEGCVAEACPAVECPNVQGGFCSSAGGPGGNCEDALPD